MVYLCFHPLPIPMAARITKYLNKYVRRGLCLIYMFSFFFLEPFVSQKNAKNQYALLPGISVTVLASHFSSVIGNFGPQGGLIYMYDTSKRLSMPLLDNYSP